MSDEWVKTLFAMPTDDMPLPLLEESLRLVIEAKKRFQQAINNYHRRVLIENPIQATAWFKADGRELVGFLISTDLAKHQRGHRQEHFLANLSKCGRLSNLQSIYSKSDAISALIGLHYRVLETGNIESYFYKNDFKYWILPYHEEDFCPNANLCDTLKHQALGFLGFAERVALRVTLSHFTLDKDTVFTWF